ncbi:MAG TPA: heavy metal translocating P-type ATPase [Patescibacteria group bacterium]|nr:heavy metal translocating P-type ATPase [Patescibacteria group bacterium]
MNKSLWSDTKFRLLMAATLIVAAFEILSLTIDFHLPDIIAIPFFAGIIVFIGYETVRNGFKALLKLNFKSINLLMLIAVLGAFYLGEYVEAAFVIVLYTLGEYLEGFGVQTSKSSMQSLVERAPKTAFLKSKNTLVPVDEIAIGEIIVVKPGDMVALDGEIITGNSSIDESSVTGEPIPADKHAGDEVFAGTLNKQGYIEVKVLKTAKDSTLAKIINLTFRATQTKANTQRFIEKFSSYYTPSIIAISLLIVIIPVLFLGLPFKEWFENAITLLVIGCPCALVISTPVSIYSAVGNASRHGIIIKGGKYIEAIGQIKAIALDKTRTITYGKPFVTDVIPFGGNSRGHVLACAAGMEMYSEHPLATSIVEAAKREHITPHAIENFSAVLGKGATADCLVCHDREHLIGKLPFINEAFAVEHNIAGKVDELQKQGKTSILVSNRKTVEGIIAMTDGIKPESKAAIEELIMLGVTPIMLTGDHPTPAGSVAQQVSITDVRAGLLPEGKADEVLKMQKQFGIIAMVGDGVNDAPALALSNVGIAMGAAGSATAIEASSIAILNDRLELLPYLVRLGRATINTIKANTAFAIGVKILFVILAILGMSHLALAIFADVGVTVLVILNSLRLLKFGGIEAIQPATTPQSSVKECCSTCS